MTDEEFLLFEFRILEELVKSVPEKDHELVTNIFCRQLAKPLRETFEKMKGIKLCRAY